MSRILSSLVAFSICCIASAQVIQSGYFLDDYVYRYRLNPAFACDTSFVGIGVGDLGLGFSSRNGLDKIVYRDGDKLEYRLHAEDLAGSFDLNLFSVGRKSSGGSYTTFEINLKGGAYAWIPEDYLKFYRNGTAARLELSGVGMDANSYLEAAFGQSYGFGDALRFGYRAKLLAGLAKIKGDASLTLEPALLTSTVSGDATVYSSFSKNTSPLIPNGFGAALDLGISCMLLDGDIKLSASLLDLGGLSWKTNIKAVTDGDSYTYDGLGLISLISGPNEAVSGQLNNIKEDIRGLYRLQYSKATASGFEMLPLTINAGASYDLLATLSVGDLFTFHSGFSSWVEDRIYVNYSPASAFSLSASAGLGTFGARFGVAANLRLPHVNLFAGTDQIVFDTVRIEGVPLPYFKANCNSRIGLAILF